MTTRGYFRKFILRSLLGVSVLAFLSFAAVADKTLTVEVTGNGMTFPAPGSYTYADGEMVNLNAQLVDGGDAFDRWTGDVPAGQNEISPYIQIPMDRDRTLTAGFSTGDWILTIINEGAGCGSTYPGPGAYSYINGRDASINENACEDGYFAGWSGDATGFAPYLFFPMDGDKIITASFAASGYTLTLSKTGQGYIEISEGSYRFAADAIVPLRVGWAPLGWVFDAWTGDLPDGVDPSAREIDVAMNQDRSVVANFIEEPDKILTIIIDGTGTTNPEGAADPGIQHSYEPGTEVDVEALLGIEGSAFSHWSGDIGYNSPYTREIHLQMTDHRTITAHYMPADYTLTVDVLGNGSTSPDPGVYGFLAGNQVEIQAIRLGGGDAFQAWSGDLADGADPESDTQLLSMDRNRSVTAAFAAGDWTLTIEPIAGGGSGTIFPLPGTYAFTDGQSASLSAVLGDGMYWGGWSGDIASYDFEASIVMDGNKTVTPNIATSGYSLTLTSSDTQLGTTEPEGTIRYMAGATPTVRAVAISNGNFTEWTGDLPEGADPNSAQIEVLMDRNRSLTAVFGTKDWYLFIQVQGNGTTDPEPGTNWYVDGEEVTVTAIPNEGAIFYLWDGLLPGEGDPSQPSVTIIMTAYRSITAYFVPSAVAVPSLIGLTQQQASNALLGYGFSLGEVGEAYSDVIEAGLVMSQSPAFGETAAFGSAVNITLSLGVSPFEEGEGVEEGEGIIEGEGEGIIEGEGEGVVEGEGEGIAEGEGEGIVEGEGEGGFVRTIHSADTNGNYRISLIELLRVIQIFNVGSYHCAATPDATEDGYVLGPGTDYSCFPHSSDFLPYFWKIDLTELLRLIQFFNIGSYHFCPGQGTDDTFCVGPPED